MSNGDDYELIVAFGKVDDRHGQVKWVQYPDGKKIQYNDALPRFQDHPVTNVNVLAVCVVDVLVYHPFDDDTIVFYCPVVGGRRVCPC